MSQITQNTSKWDSVGLSIWLASGGMPLAAFANQVLGARISCWNTNNCAFVGNKAKIWSQLHLEWNSLSPSAALHLPHTFLAPSSCVLSRPASRKASVVSPGLLTESWGAMCSWIAPSVWASLPRVFSPRASMSPEQCPGESLNLHPAPSRWRTWTP